MALRSCVKGVKASNRNVFLSIRRPSFVPRLYQDSFHEMILTKCLCVAKGRKENFRQMKLAMSSGGKSALCRRVRSLRIADSATGSVWREPMSEWINCRVAARSTQRPAREGQAVPSHHDALEKMLADVPPLPPPEFGANGRD